MLSLRTGNSERTQSYETQKPQMNNICNTFYLRSSFCYRYRQNSSCYHIMLLLLICFILFVFQLHGVSRINHDRQRVFGNLVLRHFRSPFSAEFFGYCMLNGRTQRCAAPRCQSEEMKILNISYIQVEIEPTTCRPVMQQVHRHTCVPAA